MDDEVNYTLWCGNLANQVTEELLYELFLQAGPLDKVRIPVDNSTGKNKSFAFVTFKHVESIPYTINLMNGIRLFGQQLKLQARPGSIHEQNFQNQQNMRNQPQVPMMLPPNPMLVPPGGFDNRRQPPFHPFDNQNNGGFTRSYSAPQIHGGHFNMNQDDRRSRYDTRPGRYDNSPNPYDGGGSRGHDDRSRDRSGSRSHGGSPSGRDREGRSHGNSPSRRERDYRSDRDHDQRNRDMDMRRQSVLNMQRKQLEHRQVIMEQQQRGNYSDSRYPRQQQSYNNRGYRR